MVYLHIFTHIYHKVNIPYMDAMDVFFWEGPNTWRNHLFFNLLFTVNDLCRVCGSFLRSPKPKQDSGTWELFSRKGFSPLSTVTEF